MINLKSFVIGKWNDGSFRRLNKNINFYSFSRNLTTINLTVDQLEKEYLAKTYNSDGVRMMPGLIFTHGKGSYLYDKNGNKYIDFCAGIAVSSIGHADPEWCKAIEIQSKKLCHVSNLYHTEPPLKLAQTIINNTNFDKVFFCNSGTEANEGAYKFARLYANKHNKNNVNNKNKVIAFKGGFHGRSCGSLSWTYKPAIRKQFEPLVPGVHFTEYNNLDQVKRLMDETVCAIIVEPVQGEGGIHPASISFLQGLRKLCDQYDSLLICDEVQCGLGRTGQLFGHGIYNIQPDIVTLAKPLAGGLPIGCILLTDKVADSIQTGDHGTTFGGNAIVCSAAQVVLDRLLDPSFMKNVRELGRYLHQGLTNLKTKYPNTILQIRMPIGESGLFAGIECTIPVSPIITKATAKGLLIISAGENVLRICPPLVLSKEDIDDAIQILDSVFSCYK